MRRNLETRLSALWRRRHCEAHGRALATELAPERYVHAARPSPQAPPSVDPVKEPKFILLEGKERGQVDIGGLGAMLHEQLDQAQVKLGLEGVLERALEGHLHLHRLPLGEQFWVLEHVLEHVHATPLCNQLQQARMILHLREPLAYHFDPVAVRRVDLLVASCLLNIEPEDFVEAELPLHPFPPLLSRFLPGRTVIMIEHLLLLLRKVFRRRLQRQQRTQLAAAVEVVRGRLHPSVVRVARLVDI